MKVTALEYPTAAPPIQISSPKKRAQRNEITPWSKAGARRCIGAILSTRAAGAGGDRRRYGTKKNSPSRLRFRPSLPGTFGLPPCGFCLQPSGATSTYLRSVLGARENLDGALRAFK